jgi:hypothetical protein
VRSRIPDEVGAAINGVGGTAVGITPADAAGEAAAAGTDSRRSRDGVEVWRCVSQIDEEGIRVEGVAVFAAGSLPT